MHEQRKAELEANARARFMEHISDDEVRRTNAAVAALHSVGVSGRDAAEAARRLCRAIDRASDAAIAGRAVNNRDAGLTWGQACAAARDEYDLMLYEAGYRYCAGCGEWHRPPVADDPRDPCPVDVGRVAYERAEREGLGSYEATPEDVDEARRRRVE